MSLLNNGFSNENQNILKTDVSDILVARSSGISTFLFDALSNAGGALFAPATNYKHEWVNIATKPQFFTVVSADNGAKTVTFKDNAPTANMILSLEGETNILIKSVAGMTATVEILTTGASLAGVSNALASVVSEGTPEGRTFSGGKFQGGDLDYNYTQNFDEGYTITGSMLEMKTHANINKVEVQQMFAIDRYLKKLSNAVLRGSRYTTVVAGKRVSAMGGLKSFVNVAGGNVLKIASGKTLAFADCIKLVEMIAAKGGDVSKLTMYANIKHAGIINSFNAVNASVNDNVRGGIPEFVLIPGAGKIPVKFDVEFYEKEIYLLNMEDIAVVPLGARNGYFSKPVETGDAVSSNLIAEHTLEVRNAVVDHGVIELS